MRIALLTAHFSPRGGGISEIVRQLGKALAARGDVEVFVIGLQDQGRNEDPREWTPASLRVTRVLGPGAFGYSPGLLPQLCKVNVDLVHTNVLWMYPSIACLRWRARTHRPTMATLHGMLDPWALRNSPWKKVLAGALFENRHLRRAECIHVNSVAEANAARAYGLRNPLCVLPNGIEPPAEVPTDPPAWAEKVAPEKDVLLYLGRLHPKKGLEDLLRGWHMAQRRLPSRARGWELVVAGWDQGGYQGRLESLVVRDGIANVTFVGPQFGREKWATLGRASAFVLPSLSEGLPMAPLEAWAVGLPVIMTPECNLPEGFSGGAAIAVRPEPASIAEGLSGLMTMTEEARKAMGKCGLELVRERFNWRRVTAEMSAVYKWILGGGTPPGCVLEG